MSRTGVDRYTTEEVLTLAEDGNVLIRGWGATWLLREVPHVICVRVCASMEQRIATLVDRVGQTDVATARREIRANDAAHGRAIRRLTDADWRDPLLYDLVLNTDRIPIDACVEQVLRLTRQPVFKETPESRQVLARLKQRNASWSGDFEHGRGTADVAVLREERDLLF